MSSRLISTFTPFNNKDFLRLFVAQGIALIGTGLTTVALALLAFKLARENAGWVLGVALAIKMIAYVFIAPIAGGMAQLLPRRSFLITLDIFRAGLVVLLPFVSQVWQIYLLIFLLQICSGAFSPVFQATIPDVIENEEEYTKAISLSRLSYDLESLLSPTLAGIALIFVTFSGLFIVNSLAFIVSAGLVLSVSLPNQLSTNADQTWWQRTSFGIRAYLATPRLRGLLAMSMAVAAGGAMVIVNTVVYVRIELNLDDTWTAIALSAFGFGSMVSALSLPSLLTQSKERIIAITAGGLIGISLLLGAFKPDLFGLLIVWFAIGIGYSTVLVIAGRLLLRSSKQEDRPSYFAAQFALSHACWLVTYPLAGWTGSAFGLQAAFLLSASIVVTFTIGAMIVWPNEDKLWIEHQHEALEHVHMHIHDEHHQHAHEGWEGPEPHSHPHYHSAIRHSHAFVIDHHHHRWPT